MTAKAATREHVLRSRPSSDSFRVLLHTTDCDGSWKILVVPRQGTRSRVSQARVAWERGKAGGQGRGPTRSLLLHLKVNGDPACSGRLQLNLLLLEEEDAVGGLFFEMFPSRGPKGA